MRSHYLPGLIATVCLLLPAHRTLAWQNGDEFTSIQIGLGPVVQVNSADIDTAWDPGTGMGIVLTTPFYLGEVEVGYQFTPHSAITPGVPGFNTHYVYLDWRMPIRLTERLHWSGGYHLGVVQMKFRIPDSAWSGTAEHEFGTGFMTTLEWAVLKNWSARFSAVRRKTWFYKPLHQTFISISILRRFSSPDLFREIFR